MKELKGFTRATIAAGGAAHCVVQLPARAFSRYDTATGTWVVDARTFDISVGGSSDNLPLKASYAVTASRTLDSASLPIVDPGFAR